MLTNCNREKHNVANVAMIIQLKM